MVANRSDWDEENLRVSAYEAVSLIVQNSALDMRAVVTQVLTEALSRLESTFQPNFNPRERVDLQSMLCGLIGECVKKLELEQFSPLADRTMQLLLQVFSGRGAAAHEDAFLSVGYVVAKLEKDFQRYVPYFLPALLTGLKNIEEYQVCTVAVGVVGDLSRALGQAITPLCDDIMRCLVDLLQSPTLNKIAKPQVISCFGDIALGIEGHFEKYCQPVLTLLKQAGDLKVETDDEEVVDYFNSLHVAILEAYSSILQVASY
jgi:importin subunit beta-1